MTDVSAATEIHGCTALACASDELALKAMLIARQAGIRVPEDLSIVGFDGYEPGLDLIGLTTIRLPIPAVARRPAELMFNLMTSPQPSTVHERIVGELALRTSLAPPRG